MRKLPHVIIYTDHDLAHNSFWDSLMIREAVRGTITLEFKKRSYGKSISRLFTTYTEIITGETTKRIVVDFHDNFDFIAQENLRACDVYYKVNYRPGFISTLTVDREKIKPFIPHFTVSGERDVAILSRLAGSWMERVNYYDLLKTQNLNWRKLLYQAGPARLKRYRTFVKFSDSKKYDVIKVIPDRVFFIASLYKDSTEELREVNARRINLVRLLKHEYGNHFYGGIVNSELSRHRCPDLIFQDYLPQTRYLEECKRSDICVYSNGPNNCLSWKLGEYIWLGKAVVSEELFTEFDQSFDSNLHLVESNGVDGIMNSIEDLRSDIPRIEVMTNANRKFFQYALSYIQDNF